VVTKDAIAELYGPDSWSGSMSPNELMHASTTIDILSQHELLPSHLFDGMCSIIASTILSTDMLVSSSSLTPRAYKLSFSLLRTSGVILD
jgi:hypothetical protein